MINDLQTGHMLFRSMMLQRALCFASVIAGCSSPSTGSSGDDLDDADDDGHDQLVALTGMEHQGVYLLGEMLDGLGEEPGYHANVTTDGVAADGTSLTVQFDGSASLRSGSHVGADPFFDGVI